jgi:glycine/D-amino acid oxidase-like deaminating enzyme
VRFDRRHFLKYAALGGGVLAGAAGVNALAPRVWRTRVPLEDNPSYWARSQAPLNPPLMEDLDGRVHIGGGVPQYGFNNAPASPGDADLHRRQLERELVRVYPALAGVEFDLLWSGIIDWSLSAAPSVGQTGKHRNILYGIGYSGHGVNLTSVFGRIIADMAAGRQDLWARYPFVNSSLDYVPNEPFRWVAAKAGVLWYASGG